MRRTSPNGAFARRALVSSITLSRRARLDGKEWSSQRRMTPHPTLAESQSDWGTAKWAGWLNKPYSPH